MGKMCTRPSSELRREQSEEFIRAVTVIVGSLDTCDFQTDGTTDQVEINAAVVYTLSVGGGIVQLLSQVYTLSAVITITGSVYLRGFGVALNAGTLGGTLLNATMGDAQGIIEVDGAALIHFGGVSQLSVRRAGVAGPGIRINGNADFVIEYVYIDNCVNGIFIDSTDFNQWNIWIKNCWLENCTSAGVRIDPQNNGVLKIYVQYCYFYSNAYDIVLDDPDGGGGNLWSVFILNNQCFDATVGSIVVRDSYMVTVQGNLIHSNVGIAILVELSNRISVTDNVINAPGTYGIMIDDVDRSIVSDNLLYSTTRGIYLNAGVARVCIIVSSNYIYNSQHVGITVPPNYSMCIVSANIVEDGLSHGIQVAATLTTITGNLVFSKVNVGIIVNGAYNIATGNICIECEDAIRLDISANNCKASGNYLINSTAYGLRLMNTATANDVRGNYYFGNASGSILEDGVDTILEKVEAEFTYWGGGSAGYTAPVLTVTPGGVDIDANDELAVSHRILPLGVNQVVRVKIRAYSNVIEATNNMLLRIIINGCSSNELWDTHNIDVANHPSEEEGGLVAGDHIHWVIGATDDADISALLGGDLLEILAVGEVAIAPDIATDALIAEVEIYYV